jgi:hypothetical protein
MKNLSIRLLSAAAFIIFIVSACSKNEDGSPAASSRFSASVNSTAYLPSLVIAVNAAGRVGITGYQLQGGDSTIMILTLSDTTPVNTTVKLRNEMFTYTKVKNRISYTSAALGSHGSVTISSWDKTNKRISGTFDGVVYAASANVDSIVVTNGKLNTSYLF